MRVAIVADGHAPLTEALLGGAIAKSSIAWASIGCSVAANNVGGGRAEIDELEVLLR
ncbi:MAG: hypothetical protein ACLPYS_21300 [Vulcanimicrobiaceae bacterium]